MASSSSDSAGAGAGAGAGVGVGGSGNAKNASPPSPLTLIPPGPREVVTEERAREFVSQWKAELQSHRSAIVSYVRSALAGGGATQAAEVAVSDAEVRAATGGSLCDEVVLSDKSYTAPAAKVLYDFFTRPAVGGAAERPDDDDLDDDDLEDDDMDDMDDGRGREGGGAPPSLAAGVTRLDLSDVIASRPEDEGLQVLSLLSDAFRTSKLVEVDLSDNAMGSKGIAACSSVLGGQADTLERLSLCNNGLSGESMDEVADILTGVSRAEGAGAIGIGGTTTSGGSGGGAMEGTVDDALATDGSGVVCERLTKIHFFNNMSGDAGCRAMARILHRCTAALTDVRFSGTRAGSDGSALVAAALDELGTKVRNIRRLDLADNVFRPDSTATLALFRAFGRMERLTYLDLRDCSLDDGGTVRVCHALFAASPPLEHLDLSGNEIGKRGANAVADLLEDRGETLRVLRAEENEMTSLGVKKIAMALYRLGGGAGAGAGATVGVDVAPSASSSCVLEELRLGHNECGTIGARALLDAYRGGEGMPHLIRIELDGNGFSEQDVDELRNAFGDKLGNMDDNDPEAEYDEEIDTEDEDEDGDEMEDYDYGTAGGNQDRGGVAGKNSSSHLEEVEKLADRLAKGVNVDHDFV